MWGFKKRSKPARREESASSEFEPSRLAYIEESIAYSSFLASGVAGVEEVSFEQFVQRYHESKKLPA
jgi:hypothetical protein